MKDNPFTAQLKSKKSSKLKAFGQSSTTPAKVNGKPRLRAFGGSADAKLKADIDDVTAAVNAAEKRYDKAVATERKIFRVLDKVKPSNARYTDRKRDWDESWRELDRAYSILAGESAKLIQLKKKADAR